MGENPFGKKSTMEIFNRLDYEEEYLSSTDSMEWGFSGKAPHPRENENFVKSVKSCGEAVKVAAEAQQFWANMPLVKRAKILYKIWEQLQSASKNFPKLNNQLSMFSDYFNFYSDLLLQTEEYKSWTPCGVILVIVSSWTSLFAAAATIPAALTAGCSLIISVPERGRKFFALLKEIFLKSGLEDDLFNIVGEIKESDESVFENVNKVFFFGSFTSTQKFFSNSSATPFNFFCPSNAAAIVLESADLSAVANKIVTETWGENSLFAISNVIVQESVFELFFDILNCKMKQFAMENKHSLKFKDSTVAEKIRDITSKALMAGAISSTAIPFVEKMEGCGKWSPTVIVNYQSQDIDEDAPVPKILLCRTAKEGVTLLNNCRYALATSIWSEISSQALEISAELISPNVWVNCHGAVDAGVPFQLSGFSGNFVLGGTEGILEFISPVMDYLTEKLDYESVAPGAKPDFGRQDINPELSHRAFKAWQGQNRRPFLYRIANSLEDDNCLTDVIDYYTHSGSVLSFSDRNPERNKKLFTVKKKTSVGVILLLVTTEIDKKTIVSLIMPAITFGNAVVVILRNENPSVESVLQSFIEILPNSLLTVCVGLKFAFTLASHPNIQAIWYYSNSKITLEIFKPLINQFKKFVKQIWIIPEKVPLSQTLFQNKCLQNKIVWLPKIDHFPQN